MNISAKAKLHSTILQHMKKRYFQEKRDQKLKAQSLNNIMLTFLRFWDKMKQIYPDETTTSFAWYIFFFEGGGLLFSVLFCPLIFLVKNLQYWVWACLVTTTILILWWVKLTEYEDERQLVLLSPGSALESVHNNVAAVQPRVKMQAKEADSIHD